MSWWRQILRSVIRESDVLKGTDMNGNQYFEKITRSQFYKTCLTGFIILYSWSSETQCKNKGGR